MLGQVPFGFERKVTVPAVVRSQVSMGPQVFFQHAWLLAADAAQFTDVLAPAPPPNVLILFIALEATFGELQLVTLALF